MNKKLCECGCGEIVKPGNRFIMGHNRCKQPWKPKPEPKLCECGCGEYTNPRRRFINGHQNKINHPMQDKKHSDKTRKKMSKSAYKRWEDPKEREKASEIQIKRFKDVPISYSTRKKLSASLQHILYDEWELFSLNSPYCPAFNEVCKESNREKYGRKCFLTGLPEEKNITKSGKQRKLSVHHVDMDKMQGCDGRRWKLIPVCLKWHSKIHNELWQFRIIWLLNNVWN